MYALYPKPYDNTLAFSLRTSFLSMEKLKRVFNPGRKPHPSQERIGNPTLPNPSPSSRNPLPVSFFPDGVEVLYDCSEATIDICFVHGLTGDRDSTWTADGAIHTLAQDPPSTQAQESSHSHLWLRRIYFAKICCIIKSADRSRDEPSE